MLDLSDAEGISSRLASQGKRHWATAEVWTPAIRPTGLPQAAEARGTRTDLATTHMACQEMPARLDQGLKWVGRRGFSYRD